MSSSGLSSRRAVPEQPLRLPGLRPCFELLRKTRRVRGCAKGLHGDLRRGGVVPVRIGQLRRKARDDDVRSKAADDQTTSANTASLPQMRRVFGGLGVAEVARAGEELLGPSILRAASSSCVRMSPSSDPCSAPMRFCPRRAGEREIGGTHQHIVGEIGEQVGVLVVGMRADVEHAAHHAELAQASWICALSNSLGSLALGWARKWS